MKHLKLIVVAAAAYAAITFSVTGFAQETKAAKPLNKAEASARLSKTRTTLTPQITVRNQPLVDSTIVVESFTLNQQGWVMSHLQGKGNKPGTMAGVTGPFAPGTYRNVRIKLWGNIQEGDKVWPMLHYDTGPKKGVFEGHDDHHVELNGKVVTRQITISSVKGVRPKPGNYIVMPPSRMMNAKLAPAAEKQPTQGTRTVGFVLYPNFDLLDIYGSAEVFGIAPKGFKIVMIAEKKGVVRSETGPKVLADFSFEDCPPLDLVLVPGGGGTMAEVKNPVMLNFLRNQAKSAEIMMSVCSGSAILAKSGVLDGRKATSNKKHFQVALNNGPKVNWIRKARWVDDGNRVTSSGGSSGIDMSLAVVERLSGAEMADTIAEMMEYQRHKDANDDPFFRKSQ